MKKKSIFNISLAIIALLYFAYNFLTPKLKEFKLHGKTMGTTYNITTVSFQEKKQLKKIIEEKLIKINKSMSTYIKASEISIINQTKSTQPIPISKDFSFVLSNALKIANDSMGYYDPTTLPLVNLWGFGSEKLNNNITEKKIKEIKKNIGYKNIQLKKKFLIKKKIEISIDLSSIAKGFAIDEIAKTLENQGLNRYMIEIGGEVKAKGFNLKESPWRIGIRNPMKYNSLYKIITIKNNSIATSGTYFNKREKANHIINPKTGYPVTHNTISVSVITKSNMIADAYATAFLSMGYKKAIKIAEKNNLAVLFLLKKNNSLIERSTKNFKEYILNQ